MSYEQMPVKGRGRAKAVPQETTGFHTVMIEKWGQDAFTYNQVGQHRALGYEVSDDGSYSITMQMPMDQYLAMRKRQEQEGLQRAQRDAMNRQPSTDGVKEISSEARNLAPVEFGGISRILGEDPVGGTE